MISNSYVTATASGATIYLTAKAMGTSTDYALSVSSATGEPTYFSRASFGATPSGADLADGANAVYSGADVLAETYSLDPWGNMRQSGNFAFNESFTASNQVLGFSYNAAGDLLSDGLDTYTYDDEGMLTSTGGTQYIYDALQQRVEKSGGSNPEEVIYFNGQPMALLNPSSGTWTDLIWAGKSLIAEVPGSQSAAPDYRLLNHEGSLAATTDGSGNLTGTNLMTPYGQLMASSTTDPYVYAGLYQDTEYSGDAAWYRDLSTRQARWLTPDPYNGSYDLMNPQSFNRYMYTNGNPLGTTDPSGEADGWATGIGGSPCTASGWTKSISLGDSLNPCDPIAAAISWGLAPLVNVADGAIDDIFNTALSTSLTASQVAPFVGDAIAIACSIDSNPSACGPAGWSTVAFGNGVTGKVIGDVASTLSEGIAATDGVMCMASGFTLINPACDIFLGDIIYVGASDLFSFLWDLLGNGWPKFTGSLLPRPADFGGLGTTPIGIPNRNLRFKDLLGKQSHGAVPSPGMSLP